MRKVICFFCFFLILMAGMVLPAATAPAGEPNAAVVTRPVENMYGAGTEASDVVSQAVIGTSVKILESRIDARGRGWYRVETPDTYEGWMPASSLRTYAPDEKPNASSGSVIEVTSLLALIYAESDVTVRKPLAFAPIGAVLESAGTCGERWCEVALPCGARGWIQKGDGDVRPAGFARPLLPADEMIALAKRFLGLPYLWGGTTPLGIDCSGFVQLVYKLSGIGILRDADIQFGKSGLLEVTPGTEDKGDLVFFGKSAEKIAHVGMMISREEFIHATTHDRPIVQISRLSDPYWRKLFLGSRRPRSR